MHKLKIQINKRNNKDAIQSHNGQQQDTYLLHTNYA
jgi:hypothetical protein